jgi:hypothetical protein
MAPKTPQQEAEPDTRAEQDIFDELVSLCRLPGYVHAIAFFCLRDTLVSYKETEMRPEDLLPLFSPERLIRTELSTLIGLLIKGEIDYTPPTTEVMEGYLTRTEALFEEMHASMSAEFFEGFDPAAPETFNPFARGKALREPIFYGGEAAYAFQYRDFAKAKYAHDTDWLRAEKGFSIDEAIDVARGVATVMDRKVMTFFRARSPDARDWDLLPALTFTADEIASAGNLRVEVTKNVLSAFTLPPTERNSQFASLHDFNIANACPLLATPSGEFVLFQIYSLVEGLYESPFYWMGADRAYAPTAMQHRGKFTEDFSKERLELVFGKDYVYPNVDIVDAKGKTVGEIDVLVLFGDRAIVLQAKSKRLTLEARKGNDGQLKEDFKKSVQDSYDQGYKCARLLTDGKHEFKTAQSHAVLIPKALKEIYILCVVADHYPALSLQVEEFLKTQTSQTIPPPFVLDVFTLDAMTEMLSSPLHLLSYIKRRTGYDDKVFSGHELTILSYHLKKNLWLDDKLTRAVFGHDISADLDVAMAVRRVGVPGKGTPSGLLTELPSTTLGRLVKRIEEKPDPATISLGFTLLMLGGDAVHKASSAIDKIVRMAQRDGRSHDLSFPIDGTTSGITVHCNSELSPKAATRLRFHCENRKYIHKADSWFGICLDPNGDLRFGVNLEFPWKPDSEMDTRIAAVSGEQAKRGKKLGRNDPCDCGSGKKYKKCCLLDI